MAEVWNDGRRNAVREAFAATDRPFSAQAFQQATALLDRYGERWVAMHRQTCEATRLRREQSEATMSLRMAWTGMAASLSPRLMIATAPLGTRSKCGAMALRRRLTLWRATPRMPIVCAVAAAMLSPMKNPSSARAAESRCRRRR